MVDNSSIITKIIKNFLVKTGFDKGNIFAAHDKHMAMMMFDLEKFDLVTSGIHLKGSTGIDLLKDIREKSTDREKKTPFLIISSEKQDTYQESLDKHRVSGYLKKPFNQDQFGKITHSILNQTDPTEPATQKSSAPTSTPDSQWEDSPVEVPASIIEVFTESTIEAMEQFMIEAIPGSSESPVELKGYFSSWVDLLDTGNRIQITLIINFPKKAACDIYEGIFGEVDIEKVHGVVQELSNIICGTVKPGILQVAQEIAQLVSLEKDLSQEEIELTWDVGLPESKMGEDHSLDIELNGVPKFHVPFKIKDETFHMLVLLQKF